MGVDKKVMDARKSFEMFAIELLELGAIGQMTAYSMSRATELTWKQKEAIYQNLIRHVLQPVEERRETAAEMGDE
jgi:hypothetical protein